MSQPSPHLQSAAPVATSVPAAAGAERPLRVMVPTKRRVRLRDVWTSLPVGWILGVRDVKARYKQSALGPLWLVLQPVAMLSAIAIAFSAVTSVDTGDVPYLVFALVGLAAWTYVQSSFTVATTLLPLNTLVIRRSPCPRLALITATLIGVLPPFAVVMSLGILAAALTISLPIQALLMPLLLLWLFVFSWGMTLLIAALGCRFRDVVAFSPLVLQAGIFATPVGYPLSSLDHSLALVLSLNPVSGLIETWRWSLLGSDPFMPAVGMAAASTLGLVLLGWYVFGRMETRFSDYV